MTKATPSTGYRPGDELFLWWLGEPAQPVFVGTLTLVRNPRGVSLRYADGLRL